MSFEFDAGGPIDPDEFERVFGFQIDGSPLAPDMYSDDATEGGQGVPLTDSAASDEETTSQPEPAELAELFNTLTAFNAAEQCQRRLGLDIVDGINKSRRKEEYETEGMTSWEATNFIEITEGRHAPEAEAALLDLEAIVLRFQNTLEHFGLSVTSDMFKGSRAEIVDPTKLTAGLSCISTSNLPPQVQHGLNEIIRSFTGGLWATVINNNGEQVDAYGAMPFWMESSGYYPESDVYTQAAATLAHGQELAAECERLGVDPHAVRTLRAISRYYREGMIVEWALGHEMGFDENPYQPEDDRPLYLQDYDGRFWDTYFRVLDGAEAKSQPGGAFVADQREAATLHITTYLGEILGCIQPPLTQRKFDEAWPDRDALEMEIAKNMHDPYVAKWVGWRNRLQQYGRQSERQA